MATETETENTANPITENGTQEKPTIPEQPIAPSSGQDNPISAIVDLVRSSAQEKGYNVNESPLNVFVAGKKVYSQEPGEPPKQRQFTPEKVAMLSQALENPASVKGTLKISIGEKEVYKVQNGQVKTDHLDLSAKVQQHNQAQADPAQDSGLDPDEIFEREAQQQKQSQDDVETRNEASLQSASLQSATGAAATTATQPTQPNKHSARETQRDNKALQEQISALQQQINRLEGQIQKLSGQFEKATQVSGKEQNRVLKWLSQTQNKVVEALNTVVDRLKTQSRELSAAALAGGMKAVVNTMGEKQPDGRKVLESDKLSHTHRIEVTADQQLQVSQRPCESPQQLWEKYSQGISTGHAYKDAEATLKKALLDGHTKSTARFMIAQSPQYQSFVRDKGQSAADKYADLVLQSASHKLKQRGQQEQQLGENQSVSHSRSR